MQKRLLIAASSTLLLCFSCLISQAQNRTISNNEKVPTYEIGGQIFSSNSHDLGFGWGAGGRFAYNFSEYVGFDSEVNFFLPDEGPPYATQGLFGIKAGKRTRKLGVFAKVRPGFQTNFVVNNREQARFALDVGGVFEVYPNRHLVLRLDAGDVIIPFGNNVVGEDSSLSASAPLTILNGASASALDSKDWPPQHINPSDYGRPRGSVVFRLLQTSINSESKYLHIRYK